MKSDVRSIALLLASASFVPNLLHAASPQELRLSPTNPTIVVGSSQSFTAHLGFFEGLGQAGGERDISAGVTQWISGNENFVIISPSGLATALAPGKTTITAVSGPLRATTVVTVIAPFSVVSVVPVDGATEVDLTTSVSWTFNRPANPSTVTVNTADTTCSGSLQLSSDNFATCIAVASLPAASNGNQTFTVTPQTPLPGATQISTRVTASVADLNGFTLATPFLSEFTSLAPPAPPTGVCASAGVGMVTLCWDPSATATSYRVFRSTTSGMNYVELATTTGTGYTDDVVNAGTTYFYVIQAANAAGASGFSMEVSATPN